MRTVIIGNGGAAAESIISLRGGGYDSELHLFSDSAFPAFNPTLLTYFIAGKLEREKLFHCGEDFYDKHGVTLHTGSKVVELDALNKTVLNAAGEKMSYDNCIICSGASPVVPREYQNRGVYVIRGIDDAAALKEQVSPGKKALVVGASMIGIKVVEALAEQGVIVSFADMQEHVFPLAAHPNCAALIERRLTEKGVRLLLGTAAPELSEYDFIVVCVGIRPNIDFIDRTQVDTDKGVLVDSYMRTNCVGLYAAGDVAQLRGSEAAHVAPGLWEAARYMGRTAGGNIAGRNERCPKVIRHNSTHFFDWHFAAAGDISGGDELFEVNIDNRYCAIAWKNGRPVGINLLNMPEISGILKSQTLKSPELSNVALGKVFRKYPPIRAAFLERGV